MPHNKDISTIRLWNQQIAQTTLQSPTAIVSWLGAIQGQDFTGAKWSIGARLGNVKDSDIDDALITKQLVRTWLMRGTLHVVAAKDVEWIRSLVASRIIRGNARRYKELELDDNTLFRSNDIIAKALLEHKLLSRPELLTIVEKNGISTKGQRAAYMLQRASYDGLVCQTNTVRNKPNFVLMDRSWGKGMERSEAVVELAKRYFMSRGPATIQDFVWWSGLTVSDAKAGLEANRSFLTSESIGEQTYWMSSEQTFGKNIRNSVFFLPGFDEFLLGYKDRGASIQPKYSNNWCPGNNGMFFPFLVMEGQVKATWKRIIKKDKVAIEVKPFELQPKLSDNQALSLAIEQYYKFIDLQPTDISFV